MTDYYRPLVQTGPLRAPGALSLASGATWFTHAEHLCRGPDGAAISRGVVPLAEIPTATLGRLIAPRAPVVGLTMDQPRIMAILNATPDSFSDGGLYDAPEAALEQGRALVEAGADILDIGGESTRPGAEPVPLAEEIRRTAPLISELRRTTWTGPISIDTRNGPVARAAVEAGADMLNDVSALSHDATIADVAVAGDLPICLMHAQGDPETMQDDPRYGDVRLDVYDHLAERIAVAEAAGIARDRIIIDPGIGFGKTLAHNLALLSALSLFHGLGCPILLGASRKRFIGTLGHAPIAADRAPGSIAVALAAIAQGVQIVRVHDMAQTRQALTLWQASIYGDD